MLLEGVVEQGQIKLDSDIQLPDGTKVYVVAPDTELDEKVVHLHSRHLANPKQADFEMEVIESGVENPK